MTETTGLMPRLTLPATATRATVLHRGAKAAALLLLALGGACGPAAAPAAPAAPGAPGEPEPETLRLATAALAVDQWALFIARETGIFTRHGLTVEVSNFETPASVIQALSTGAVDLGTCATDLVVNAVERGVPLVEVAGIYNKATYSLVGAKGLTSAAELRGKTLAVSDLKDATTLLLRKLLKGHGLGDGDYDVLPMGGTSRRAAAIVGGQAAGALLAVPTNFAMEDDGYPRLGFTSDVLPEYQFETLHVQRPWARDHGPALVRFLRAMIEASRWLYDPAHREAAIALLVAQLKISPDVAGRSYDLAVTELQAFPREGEISPEGSTAVLETMAELGQIGRPLPPIAKYIDTSYLQLAQKGL